MFLSRWTAATPWSGCWFRCGRFTVATTGETSNVVDTTLISSGSWSSCGDMADAIDAFLISPWIMFIMVLYKLDIIVQVVDLKARRF